MGVPRISLAAVAAWVVLVPVPAFATYSIVGANTATREVGGAGTSCVGRSISVYEIYGSAADRGAVAAQAAINRNGRDAAVQQLGQGTAPAQIIQNITAASFDSQSRSRQYGIVDVQGRAAGFTGTGDQAFADDRQGTVGTYAYSVQGNILTGVAVLTQASAAFEGGGCDLADKLMRALEAGAQNQQGDSRCTPDIPSDGAFIQVDRPNEARGSYLRLRVDATGTRNPITLLRADFDAWRADHPCPGSGTGGTGGMGGTAGAAGTNGNGGSAGSSGGAAGTTGSGGTGGTGGSAGSNPTGGSAGAPEAGGALGSAGTGGSGGGAGTAAATSGTAGDDGGCGCRTSGHARSTAILALVAGLLLLRRAPRRSTG